MIQVHNLVIFKTNFSSFLANFQFRAEVKILQLKLWLEPALLGLITSRFCSIKLYNLFMYTQASCTKSIKDIIKHMGVGPWVQPIKLSFPFTLKHHAVYYFLCMCPAKKKGFLYRRRVTSNQMLFWLSDIFLRIGTGQPPTVVKNLLPTSSCISVRLQIGDIYKLEIWSFLSKALSM